jgi:hypothetical protein
VSSSDSVFAAVLLLLAAPEAVQAQFSYTTSGGAVTITGYNGPGGAVTIPSVINGLPVTSIRYFAFANCTALTSVTIPGSITNMGNDAFDSCSGLTSVTIADGVTSIGEQAFWDCYNLTSVTIPGSVTNIGNNAFTFCSGLTNVTMGNGVLSIGGGAFMDDSALTGSLTIPGSVTNIGDEAFDDCFFLTNVTMGNGVLSIGELAFYSCASLTSLTIPGSVTNIGEEAFDACSGLTSVTVGSSVTSIGDFAFANCTSLTSVYFMGNAPSTDSTLFAATPATAYYFYGTTGWNVFAAATGIPAVMLNPPPGTMVGDGFLIEISSGTSPLASYGYSILLVGDSGNSWNLIGIYNVQDDSGTYTYTNAGPYATVIMNDATETDNIRLTFTSPTQGTFFSDITYPPAYSGLTQSGNFVAATGTALNSIAGLNVLCSVANGYAPFAASGSYTIVFATSGNTYVMKSSTGVKTSSGRYSYSVVNRSTAAIQITDSLAGSFTVYVGLSNQLSGGYAITQPSTGGFQVGAFSVQTGSLQVTITPSAAVSAGAQWRVDGGAWQNSGTTVSLTVGSHTLSFNAIGGWNAPPSQTVAINNGQTITACGNYTQQTGSLQVTISPTAAIAAGAKWQVDGGAWRNSGATVADLQVGSHTVSFNTISGWTTPTNQTISVRFNSTVAATGAYARQTGSLTVTINPEAAISAGAKWRVDEGTLQSSGAMVTNLWVENHTVSFNTISGWIAPSNQTISVSANSTATASGTYVPQTGSLKVTISPARAITAGAQWQVDGGTLQNSGATVSNLSLGTHTVSFNTASGWTTPANETVSIRAKSVSQAKGTYTFSAQGIYNGLFMQADATEETAGMLSGLDVTASGTYSGQLWIGGGPHFLSGGFNVSGQASNYVQRTAKQGGPLTVEMTLNWNDSPPNITGTVSGTNGGPWVANLTNELAAKGSSSAEYTALVLPDGTPPGYSYILITNHAGAATLSVTLADGTSFSQAVPVSGTGDLPVYGNLYAGTGLILGWLGLENGSPTGNLTWIKPASRSTALYTNGFTNLVVVQVSLWTNPLPHTAAIDLPSGQLDISDGSLRSPLSFNVAVSNNNALVKLPGSPTNSLTGSINAKTGLLTATFGNGAGKATTAAKGAVLQNVTNAAGFFLGKTNAGSMVLQP